MNADRSIFDMASKIVSDPLTGNNSRIQGQFVEIYRLEQKNLFIDAFRMGKATADALDAVPEVMGKTQDAAFNYLGGIRDQNNAQVQRLLEQAAAILAP